MTKPVSSLQPLPECKNSAWMFIFYLREGGHLEDPRSMQIIHKYLLECCRRIWDLLPDEGSRKGVEAAEKYCRGEITWEQASETDWHSEGSAFLFEYREDSDPDLIEHIGQINLKRTTVGRLLVPPVYMGGIDIKELLKAAAYFANEALNYPFLSGGSFASRKESMRQNSKFLPLDLFEIMVPIELRNKVDC